MAKILITYHSQAGNTEKLARSVAQGVSETGGVQSVLKRAAHTDAQDIRDCAALVICSPEYFGYMAGSVKDLFDRTYEELKDDAQSLRKPYAVVISAGNDGNGALTHIERICKGYRFRKVQNPIICKGRVTEGNLAKCHEMGMTIAEGVKTGIF
jgi:multimeric flavodoxin WrbA